MAKAAASLQTGEKILHVEFGKGHTLTWETLQHVEVASETSMLRNEDLVIVGLGADISIALRADQVVLTRNRKKKIAMQTVRRLEVGYDCLVALDASALHRQGKKSWELKKIKSLRLVRQKDPSECYYKLEVGSPNQSLLMSYSEDSDHFLVVHSSDSTMTLQEVVLSGMRRSYTDTPVHKPPERVQREKARTVPTSILVDAHAMVDLECDEAEHHTTKRSNEIQQRERNELCVNECGVQLPTASSILKVGR